jgi:uncharacterized lipoprotein YddW (UPF0748 family)
VFSWDFGAKSSSLACQTIISVVSLLSFTFTSIYAPKAWAGEGRVGVVKTYGNSLQWETTLNRLQATGINYCIIDSSSWQQEADLANISVLFLPNVETLESNQVNFLERWLNKGGKAIATGRLGLMSQPEVRSQLRTIFGGYWGFPMSSPSTLKPLSSENNKKSNTSFSGGVIIPAGLNSKTVAVWQAEGEPPAIISTNNSTLIGWRWGIKGIAPEGIDVAWLQGSLNRYGIKTGKSGTTSPPNCNNKLAGNTNKPANNSNKPNTSPVASNNQTKQPSIPNVTNSTPLKVQPTVPSENETQGVPLSVREIQKMTQELEGLIDRFNSSLLLADAIYSNVDLSTTKAVEQLLASKNSKVKSQAEDSLGLKLNSSNSSAHQALVKAIENRDKFLQLLKQQKYNEARNKWSEARRTLWDNYPLDRQLAQPEIRSIWLDRGTIVKAKSPQDLAKLFDRLAAAGINTIFFEAVNASYTIYPSQVAPEQNPLTKGWDPLEAAVKLAHERGMELHAWAWIFAAANQRHNLILNQPLDYLGPILSKHPEWAITNKQNSPFDFTSEYKKSFLDPANPEVRKYLLSLLEEIVDKYQVDGIQLDYIRYPFQDPDNNQLFGYSPISRQLFKQQTGIDPIAIEPSHPLWNQWTNFRAEQVSNFVCEVSQTLKQKRPELILSAAVFPMSRGERLEKIQQNWETWVDNEWIDLLVPMTYATEPLEYQKVAQSLFERSSKGATFTLPSIRLLNLPHIIAVDRMQLIRDLPAGGYALFAMENLNSTLERTFSRTQAGNKKTEPIPHRQPFQAALIRYQTLQKEWIWSLANNKIVMEEEEMKNWSKEADALLVDLTKLASTKSLSDLLYARMTLSSLKRQFPKWMKNQKIAQPYQVKVWENRLEMLDKLLDYGQKSLK